jgi:hypothetical protein
MQPEPKMLEPRVIDERIDYLLQLVAITRQLIVANAEIGALGYSGALALLDELEKAIKSFGAELMAAKAAEDRCKPA